jgi:hypothetical protein
MDYNSYIDLTLFFLLRKIFHICQGKFFGAGPCRISWRNTLARAFIGAARRSA